MKRYILNLSIERHVRDRGRRRLERANFTGIEVVAVDRKALTGQVLALVKSQHPGYKLCGYSIIKASEEIT
jgi:hypothetical protein